MFKWIWNNDVLLINNNIHHFDTNCSSWKRKKKLFFFMEMLNAQRVQTNLFNVLSWVLCWKTYTHIGLPYWVMFCCSSIISIEFRCVLFIPFFSRPKQSARMCTFQFYFAINILCVSEKSNCTLHMIRFHF